MSNKNNFMEENEQFGMIFNEKITQKRRETNPYIEKVLASKHILTDETKIFSQAGKWNEYFWNENEVHLEIGTGLGNFFSDIVSENPDINYLGVELKYKRLYVSQQKCLEKNKSFPLPGGDLEGENTTSPSPSLIRRGKSEIPPLTRGRLGGENFVLLKTKGQNINRFLADEEIAKTYIFFPDPWGRKERQKKHRIFQEDFIKDLYAKTKQWGKLIFKTDHREYFDTTMELFEKIGLWKEVLRSYDYEADDINYSKAKKTEFEVIFDEKKVCYVEFEK